MDTSLGPLRGPGSKGSARLGQAGSKGSKGKVDGASGPKVAQVQRVQRVWWRPSGAIYNAPEVPPCLHGVGFITSFEPARSVGGTGAAQGAARRRLEPGRRKAPEPSCGRESRCPAQMTLTSSPISSAPHQIFLSDGPGYSPSSLPEGRERPGPLPGLQIPYPQIRGAGNPG
jgi:hypothetical protein